MNQAPCPTCAWSFVSSAARSFAENCSWQFVAARDAGFVFRSLLLTSADISVRQHVVEKHRTSLQRCGCYFLSVWCLLSTDTCSLYCVWYFAMCYSGVKEIEKTLKQHVARGSTLVFDGWKSTQAAADNLGFKHAPPIVHDCEFRDAATGCRN